MGSLPRALMSSRAAPAWETKNCCGLMCRYALPKPPKDVSNSRPSAIMWLFFHCGTHHFPHWAFALLIVFGQIITKIPGNVIFRPKCQNNLLLCSMMFELITFMWHWVCPQQEPIAPALTQCLHNLRAGLLPPVEIKCWLSLLLS